MKWIKKVNTLTRVEEAVTRGQVGEAYENDTLKGTLPFGTKDEDFAQTVCDRVQEKEKEAFIAYEVIDVAA